MTSLGFVTTIGSYEVRPKKAVPPPREGAALVPGLQVRLHHLARQLHPAGRDQDGRESY